MLQIEKQEFVLNTVFEKLQHLETHTPAAWGKMNALQMLDHLTEFFDVSANKISLPLVTPEALLPKYLEFLRSEKPFRENTKAPESVIPEMPLPPVFDNIPEAIDQLKKSIEGFSAYFSANPNGRTLHPVFGWLTYPDWIQLHDKHMRHHLNQFGLLN